MDYSTVLQILNDTINSMDGRSCSDLMSSIDFLDIVQIEGNLNELFKKRIEFICASHIFHSAMIRDYGRKQIKRFLISVWKWEDERAASTAKSLNEARLVLKHFRMIAENCYKCSRIDIRSLTIHELYLAKNLSWVIRRSVDSNPSPNSMAAETMDMNTSSIHDTVQNILNSTWYNDAKNNTMHVAKIMKIITSRVIDDSVYRAGR